MQIKGDAHGNVLISENAKKVRDEPEPDPPRTKCKNVCRMYFIGITAEHAVWRCGTCLHVYKTKLVEHVGQGDLFWTEFGEVN